MELESSSASLPHTTSIVQVLDEHRALVARRVMAGASGAETLAAMTEFVDGLIIGRYRDAMRHGGDETATVGTQQCCLMALGGYGRRELAPQSDIDLMFLYQAGSGKAVESLIRAVLHPLWDCGFQVGHSVRTIADSIELADTDATVKTSMMEARFLAGSSDLFQEFHRKYWRKIVSKNSDLYLDQKLEERRREYQKFGETVYLLEPNVKKSKGGLRDLHLLQWAGMARFQAPTIRELSDRGILSRTDSLALTEAREFLWRVRALLHVHAGAPQEILTFDEQVWLAQHFGYHDQPHLLAVEQPYDRRQDGIAFELAFLEVAFDPGAEPRQRVAEFQAAFIFGGVALEAIIGMVAILLAAAGVATGGLEVPVGILAEPGVDIGWRERD